METVKELIARLEKLDQDMPVAVGKYDYQRGWYDLSEVALTENWLAGDDRTADSEEDSEYYNGESGLSRSVIVIH